MPHRFEKEMHRSRCWDNGTAEMQRKQQETHSHVNLPRTRFVIKP